MTDTAVNGQTKDLPIQRPNVGDATRTKLREHPDVILIDIGDGTKRPWLLSALTPQFLEAEGQDPSRIVSAYAVTQSADLAWLIWAGCVVFEPDLDAQYVAAWITPQAMVRLGRVLYPKVIGHSKDLKNLTGDMREAMGLSREPEESELLKLLKKTVAEKKAEQAASDASSNTPPTKS